jgi:hypothetical protein
MRGILRAAAQHNRANVGVYASVLQCQAGVGSHYLTCLHGLLTANKVAQEFEFTPLRQRVPISGAYPVKTNRNRLRVWDFNQSAKGSGLRAML